MENSSNKQFTSFELHTLLDSGVKSCTALLHPAWDVNCAFVQRI